MELIMANYEPFLWFAMFSHRMIHSTFFRLAGATMVEPTLVAWRAPPRSSDGVHRATLMILEKYNSAYFESWIVPTIDVAGFRKTSEVESLLLIKSK